MTFNEKGTISASMSLHFRLIEDSGVAKVVPGGNQVACKDDMSRPQACSKNSSRVVEHCDF